MGASNFFLIRGRAFRRTVPLVAAELLIAALAVLAAANLVTTAPPPARGRARTRTAPDPAAARLPVIPRTAIGALHLYGEATASTVHVAVILPAPGEQQYE